MRIALKPLLFIFLLSACLTVSASAEGKTDINSLINDSKTYNNQTVTVEGEAIGEVLERGDYAWVNINDGTNAIGIWMKEADAKTIQHFGDYKHIGDTLRITGAFSRDCTEHGGDVDIHCASMKIVKSGYTVKNAVSNTKAVTAAILLGIALVVAYLYFQILRHKKQQF